MYMQNTDPNTVKSNIETLDQLELRKLNKFEKLNSKNSVNINSLLNKLRTEQKKEKIESYVLLGMISALVLITGLVVSL
jgi:hypothetical protein